MNDLINALFDPARYAGAAVEPRGSDCWIVRVRGTPGSCDVYFERAMDGWSVAVSVVAYPADADPATPEAHDHRAVLAQGVRPTAPVFAFWDAMNARWQAARSGDRKRRTNHFLGLLRVATDRG